MAVTTGERRCLGKPRTDRDRALIALTFIIAILVQELQAFISGQSGLVVAVPASPR